LRTEIVAVTDYHRKAALRCLRAGPAIGWGVVRWGGPRRFGAEVGAVARWGPASGEVNRCTASSIRR
jgi:hypothetical protein